MVRVHETRLEQRRVTPAYRARLRQGLELIMSWLSRLDVNVAELIRSDDVDYLVLDQWVCDYINWAADADLPFWLVKHGVMGLQTRFRHLRGNCIGPGIVSAPGKPLGRIGIAVRLPWKSWITCRRSLSLGLWRLLAWLPG